jgi:hypothetical protein
VARSMAPERLLTAKSAAGFIEDEQLLQLVRMLGAPVNTPQAPALPGTATVHDLH